MLAFLAVWLTIAVITAVVMTRRGHSWFTWAVIGGVLGPLAWPLAVRADMATRAAPLDPPVSGDVLIGLAPWTGSPEPIVEALRRLDPAPRSVTVVSVLDAEDATTHAGHDGAREAGALLDRCCRAIRSANVVDGRVECRVVYGRPADELARLARSGAYRRIVLGPSGSTMHHVLHGHTGTRLEHLTSVPLLERETVRRVAR
jgi:nucleotide-binding universal stress UspA family protein